MSFYHPSGKIPKLPTRLSTWKIMSRVTVNFFKDGPTYSNSEDKHFEHRPLYDEWVDWEDGLIFSRQ